MASSDAVDPDRGPDMTVAQGIMERSIRICPALVPAGAGTEGLRVIRHQIGYRPCRAGGPRVELEQLHDADLGILNVLHGYGVGGTGYQLSYGIADDLVSLVSGLAKACSLAP